MQLPVGRVIGNDARVILEHLAERRVGELDVSVVRLLCGMRC
jgi:hypothetical protein